VCLTVYPDVLLILAAIGILSLASQWLAWRLRVPAILFLLAGGILLGPVLGWLNPDALFGELLFPFTSLAVAVILFEGSLTLNLKEIQGHGVVVRRLITVGVVIIWLAVAALTHFVMGTSWQLAFLFGAIMTVTGPTVIMPMLQAVRPSRAVGNILRWEGILVDPLGAILAVLTFTIIQASRYSSALDEIAILLLKLVLAGVVVGGAIAWMWSIALRRYWVPQFLQNVATLIVVFTVYAIADHIEAESGLLAVTVMGVWLANTRGLHIQEILHFKESLSLLLISGLFILLAARLEFAQLELLGWPALLVMLGIQLLARPFKVWVCTLGSSLNWQERATLAWIGPRGIIAAAISAVFALRLEAQGIAGAELLVPLAFVVIVGTVVIQSLTARPLASRLGVVLPEPEGVLLLGGNALSTAIGKVLKENEFSVVVSHSSWDGLRSARMAGLDTFYGNPMSERAERLLDLSGMGKLFAMSGNSEFNSLACAGFVQTFGRQNVYYLPVTSSQGGSEPDTNAGLTNMYGRQLFADDVSLSKLLSLLSQGATIKTTRLSASFDYEEYLSRQGKSSIPLLAWNDKRQLKPIAGGKWKPEAEWTVASLVPKAGAAENGSTGD
jgi:NhaP-type Na+/H+ or K+/H+ antiporter